MSAKSSLQRFVRELGRFLAGHGYDGAGGRVFRKYSPAGDALIIDVQTSSASDRAARYFYLNTALVFGPAWAMYRRRTGRPAAEPPGTVHGLWRDRVRIGLEAQFRITDDASADAVWADVRPALAEQLVLMDELLDRDRLREQAESGELRRVSRPFVRAWLLAAAGDRDGLDELLTREYSAAQRESAGLRDMLSYVAERDDRPVLGGEGVRG